MRRSIVACAVGFACVLTAPVRGEQPYSFDSAPGRLPKNIVPIDYTVDLTPDIKAMTIAGTERVTLQVRAATNSIQFNSLNEVLRGVRLDGKAVMHVVSDDEKQLTTLTLSAAMAPGRHLLTFSYTAKIESSAQGLFLQPYSVPQPGTMLSTQMESTDARRMFPCWDEPAFRARFRLSARIPAKWSAVGNMPIATRTLAGDVATVTFQRTPRMPSYLIELTAGDIASVSAKSDGYDFAVWAVKGREHEGDTALRDAQLILADYNDYFGYRFPLPKLDSLAIPGGFSGAMENWGAITYNDQLLLVTPTSSLGDKQQVFAVQAHEMAHQWNGDLVTMGWWDDIWLNESFASWMAAKETAQRHPEWKWWENQDSDKEGAMGADARSSSHAIQSHVIDELQVTNAFDPQITYSKGQAILRMFEAYLGPNVFRSGIRSYMQARAFSNATSADLWNALSAASGKQVGQIASGWTEQPGFPLVRVSAQCDAGARTVSVSQQRFLLSGGADPAGTQWSVPLQIRVGEASTMQSTLLTQNGQKIAAGRCDEALSVNASAIGYFRTQYDSATLANNTRDFGKLPDADRIVLLDDQWALVSTGVASLPTYLALASSMGEDLDPAAWLQIAGSLATVEYAEHATPGHDAFARYARSVLKPALDSVGWDAKSGESPSMQELRRALIADMGLWGDQDVVTEARRRFVLFMKDHQAIAPDYQSAILDIVAHQADAATFDQIYQFGRASSDDLEKQRCFAALMNVVDPTLAEQAAKIITSDDIPPQMDSLRLQLIIALAHNHQQLSWDTFTAHSELIMRAATTFAPMVMAQYLPQSYWSGVSLADVETFVRAHVPAEMSDVMDRGMESAHFKLNEKTLLVREADSYVQQKGG